MDIQPPPEMVAVFLTTHPTNNTLERIPFEGLFPFRIPVTHV